MNGQKSSNDSSLVSFPRRKARREKVPLTAAKTLTVKKERGASEKVRLEISAGGIVFRRTPKGVRVALVLDPYNKWSFAKGHVEKGETLGGAAIRETQEEMGIRKLRIVASLGKIDLWFRDRYRPATRGRLIHKYVNFFLMEAPSRAWGKPQKTEMIRQIIWVPLPRLRGVSDYEDVKPLIDKVIRILNGRFKD